MRELTRQDEGAAMMAKERSKQTDHADTALCLRNVVVTPDTG